MKNTSTIFSSLIITALIVQSCGNTPSGNTQTQTQALSSTARVSGSNEFDLDLQNTVLPYPSYLVQSENFTDFFKVGSDTFDSSQYEAVNYSSLAGVIDSLSGVTGVYFTGFRIAYTLDASNKIRLYYIPVIASETGREDGFKVFSFSINEDELDEIIENHPEMVFMEESGDLVRVDRSTTDAALANFQRYKSEMMIYSPVTSTFVAFHNSDATSGFIAMQEIDSLVRDNNQSKVYFTSTTKLEDNKYRHSIAMVTELTSSPGSQDSSGFVNKGANLAQLCPLRCKGVLVDHKEIHD